jgi:hypothetical protein
MLYTVFKSIYFAYFTFTMTYDIIFLRNSINKKNALYIQKRIVRYVVTLIREPCTKLCFVNDTAAVLADTTVPNSTMPKTSQSLHSILSQKTV